MTAIDRSEGALQKAKAEAARQQLRNIRFLAADLEKLPLEAASADLVVISQSLHHVGNIDAVLAEAARLLKPGGRVVVLELLPHDEAWVKSRLGHQHLGFDPDAVQAAMARAGLETQLVHPGPRDTSSPFKAFLLTGTRSRKSPARLRSV